MRRETAKLKPNADAAAEEAAGSRTTQIEGHNRWHAARNPGTVGCAGDQMGQPILSGSSATGRPSPTPTWALRMR